MKHLGTTLLAICMVLAVLMLAMAMVLQASTALAATLNVSGLVCLVGLMLPLALAGAGLVGYTYAQVQPRRARQAQRLAAQGRAMTRMTTGVPPTVFVVRQPRPGRLVESGYPAAPRLPLPEGGHSQKAVRAGAPTTSMLASIYGFAGPSGTGEGCEDED